MIKKQNLPSKICIVCERPFTWRKKWQKVWNEVKYCSEKCKRFKVKKLKIDKQNYDIDSVIEMAWCDKTSFDSIKAQTGIPEKDVIKIMRSNLKKTSFKVWRERVYGRKAKHAKK